MKSQRLTYNFGKLLREKFLHETVFLNLTRRKNLYLGLNKQYRLISNGYGKIYRTVNPKHLDGDQNMIQDPKKTGKVHMLLKNKQREIMNRHVEAYHFLIKITVNKLWSNSSISLILCEA